MRLVLVVTIVAILGASLGIAHTWSELSGVDEQFELPAAVSVGDAAVADVVPADTIGTPLATIVGEPIHDFGLLRREASSRCSFIVRNDGDADLLIEKQTVSCGLCVQTTLTTATVKPGEEVVIPVSLTARKPGPELNEALEVRTNDKTHEVIRFELIAYISEAAGASVSELALGTISTADGATSSFNVYGFNEEQLEIVECSMSDGDGSGHFKWQIHDLPPDAVKAGQSHAYLGKKIDITIEPGLPVGPVRLHMTIVARAGEEVRIDVPVTGQVAGDLSLIGGSTYTPSKSLLSIGRILVGEGATVKMHIILKGEHRDDVQVSVGECDPAGYLSATIGERKAMESGKASLIPLVVEIAKDAPAANHLGGTTSRVGKIVLQTTHPTTKELTLYVRFAVE